MEFKHCDTFKCLRADGTKGIYFITEGAWCHLNVIQLNRAADTPERAYISGYESIEDAIKDAEEIDGAEDE